MTGDKERGIPLHGNPEAGVIQTYSGMVTSRIRWNIATSP
jgi:hypothetical protein